MTPNKAYKSWNPSQAFLLPPSPDEWLPEGHMVYFVLDVVSQLDLRAITDDIQQKDARGTQPYAPQMMVALLLYGYCVGVYSSRRLERATYEDVGFRVLAGGQHPHFTTINDFRKRHLKALGSLFLQVLKLCRKAGLVKLGHVAVDGTKLQGNASKHKAMSYKRMKEEEKRLEGEIEQMLRRAQQVDEEENEKYGPGNQDEDLPEELRRRESRLEKIKQAKQALEEEAKQVRARKLRQQGIRAERRSETHADPVERRRAATMAENRRNKARDLDGRDDSDDDNDPPTTGEGLSKHEPQVNKDGSPDDKAQMNFTDSESRIMESGGSFLQGYNCQAAVDEEHQIIVAQAVSNKCPDNDNLVPMLELVKSNCGQAAQKATADTGYWKPGVEARGAEIGTDVFVATGRKKRVGQGSKDSTGEEELQDDRGRMRAKLLTEEGRKIYRRRKAVVEPIFGQAKEARGFRRFLLRGLKAAGAEWSLVCTVSNLLKLYRAKLGTIG
jgi:transposase